jgi:hypothetical protein
MNKTPERFGRVLDGVSSTIWILPPCSDMARAKEELPLIKEAIAELEFTASEMTPASMDRNSQVSLAMRCRTSVMIKADEALQATSTFTARNIITHFWLNLCSGNRATCIPQNSERSAERRRLASLFEFSKNQRG